MSAMPVPTPDTLPFWEGTAVGQLRMPYCGDCSEFFFYPRLSCPACGARDLVWKELTGRARLVSYVVDERGMGGRGKNAVIALVQLEEGPRMLTNVVGVPSESLPIALGLPLKVAFEACETVTLPVFTIESEAE